ncbi:DUF4435 domain-containing protein [Leptotrichia trevisanii]|uniref:DUF4435 domain-containing protein n=1 Tax=Leptotrichia trevisanii TaxID=109328 RepID=UPI0026F116F5|nr:DUF4435 domain-containing protein [Leptotrichia trevisanii]
MVTVERMITKKHTAPAAWMLYTRSQNRKNQSCIFCFFEGEDRKYYLDRIGKYCPQKIIEHFDCKGRENVISVYKKLIQEEEIDDRFLFFIDRDYNLDSYENNSDIYQTSEYSIENYYCKKSSMESFLFIEVGMNKSSEDFRILIEKFCQLKEKFVNYYTCINIWYIACKKCDINVEIDRMLSINDFFLNDDNIEFKNEFSLESITTEYLKKLEKDCENNKKNAYENLENYQENKIKIETLILDIEKEFDKSKDFRGKFLILFLRKYINFLKNYIKNYKTQYKYNGFSFNEDDKNILSSLSSYAETPECLKRYLERITS